MFTHEISYLGSISLICLGNLLFELSQLAHDVYLARIVLECGRQILSFRTSHSWGW